MTNNEYEIKRLEFEEARDKCFDKWYAALPKGTWTATHFNTFDAGFRMAWEFLKRQENDKDEVKE